MSDFCITTLSAGEKYNSFLLETINSNNDLINSCDKFLITTDDEQYFKDNGYGNFKTDKVQTFSFEPRYVKDISRNRKWFDFHLKRHAIRNAFNSGYTKILYMDSDTHVIHWDTDFFIKPQKGFWFRTLLGRNQYRQKYNFYNEKYNVDNWHYYRPVSEKLIYINECRDKIDGFLKCWEFLAKEAEGKINPYSEGHEILISCRFNGASINAYKPDPFKGPYKYLNDTHIMK